MLSLLQQLQCSCLLDLCLLEPSKHFGRIYFIVQISFNAFLFSAQDKQEIATPCQLQRGTRNFCWCYLHCIQSLVWQNRHLSDTERNFLGFLIEFQKGILKVITHLISFWAVFATKQTVIRVFNYASYNSTDILIEIEIRDANRTLLRKVWEKLLSDIEVDTQFLASPLWNNQAFNSNKLVTSYQILLVNLPIVKPRHVLNRIIPHWNIFKLYEKSRIEKKRNQKRWSN